jgi:hypothetical protein
VEGMQFLVKNAVVQKETQTIEASSKKMAFVLHEKQNRKGNQMTLIFNFPP